MNSLPFNPGDILLGKYRMDRLLGMGSMGVVVAATHIALQQRVAIKFMLASKAGSHEQNERFLREARAAVQLQSQHVARVTDVGASPNGVPYLVMELLSGKDLEAVLAERGALPYAEAVDYVLQACEAVAEAHHLGIVHRDLKPANLFLATVAGCPCVKVLDFGVAKVLNAAKLTTDGTSMGSPYYMSPEQMRDGASVDARSDVWALGVILYQLATNKLPFESDTIPGLCAQVFLKPPIPMGEHRNDIPPGFEAVILRCLEKDREKRVQSVIDFAMAIAPFGSPESMSRCAKIAAAGGARLPMDSSTSSGLHVPPPHTKGATTGSPIVAQGAFTVSGHKPRPVASIAIALALTISLIGGVGAMYLRSRHVASATNPTPDAAAGSVTTDLLAAAESQVPLAVPPTPSSVAPSAASSASEASKPSLATSAASSVRLLPVSVPRPLHRPLPEPDRFSPPPPPQPRSAVYVP